MCNIKFLRALSIASTTVPSSSKYRATRHHHRHHQDGSIQGIVFRQPTTQLLNATIMEWCICLPVIWQPSNTGYPSKILTGGISPHRWPKGMSQCYYNDECSPCSNQYCMQTLLPRGGIQAVPPRATMQIAYQGNGLQ